jgi:hypothetical protein
MPHLFLRPHGNLGNKMMQIMTAERLRQDVHGLTYSGYNIPYWNLKSGRIRNNRPPLPRIRTQDIDINAVKMMMAEGELPLSVLRCIVLQSDFWGDPDYFRSFFPSLVIPSQRTNDDELLINVRGAEILKARSTVYGPIPVAYYERIIAETGLKPVFLGQLGNDYNTKLLQSRFPNARFVKSQGVLEDFEAIRGARNIVVSLSSFSWLAAWLSKADTIHMPLLGLFNPSQRPDISLAPAKDARYKFSHFPVREWVGSHAQIEDLAKSDPSEVINTERLQALQAEAKARRKEQRKAAFQALSVRARRIKPYGTLLKWAYPQG